MDIHFPPAIYKKLLNEKMTIEDVSTINKSIYNGLKWLTTATSDEINRSEIYFEINIEEFGNNKKYPLGSHSLTDLVTFDNRFGFFLSFFYFYFYFYFI